MTRKGKPFDNWDLLASLSFLILLLLMVVALIKPDLSSPLWGRKPKVAATIFPIYDLTRQIAGHAIETTLVLKPGASPHTFAPTAEELRELSGSQIIFAIGHGLDDWASEMARNAGADRIVLVDQAIELINEEDPTHPVDHETPVVEDHNGHVNPHYWLTIPNAQKIAHQIARELTRQFPAHQETFSNNLNQLNLSLADTDSQIRDQLSRLSSNQIATFHDAWAYFAAEYNIEVVTVFEEFPGKEPTPQYLAEFQDQIRTNNVKIIFVEPQFATSTLAPIAADLNAELSILDPIGGVAGRESFHDLMLYNTTQINNALK